MRIYTSYFYQIRFFPRNLIPISTALWDPKWYHNFAGQSNVFLDKRGVVNGLRAPALAPGSQLDGTCHGAKDCTEDPLSCYFLHGYREQLDQIDCDDYVYRLENLARKMQRQMGFEEEPAIALIVHEAPTNRCSERVPIQQWLSSNGYDVVEWSKNG